MGMSLNISIPGVSFSTIIMEQRRCIGASSSATTMNMMKSARDALVIIHLRPLMTHSSFSSTALVCIWVGSVPATHGSVMAKALRISPFRLGQSHFSFCSGVPPSANNSELPESGAILPKTSCANVQRPVSRFIKAKGSCPIPCPPSAFSRWHAHRP